MIKNFRCIILFLVVAIVKGEQPKCDQTPIKATVDTPSESTENQFLLSIETKQEGNKYSPDQTYVVTLENLKTSRPFKWFMITAEDPDIDNDNNIEDLTDVDVGILKPLNDQSRYSERCFKTVEETNELAKSKVNVHWRSPKQSLRPSVRLRAMVAENEELWYTGDNLTLIVYKLNQKPKDRPPLEIRQECNLCTEALYEVTFTGEWSRLTHPLHYPMVPDDTGYSEMIGASHDNNFELWKADSNASPGLKELAEDKNITTIQRYIIDKISPIEGVRTLIKARGHKHPHMSVPSYALFRVDKIHHLFSLVVALIPSPDWFLGTSMFELCMDHKWLDNYTIPMYPWDAGTANGISYESETSVTQPTATVQRVQVGSFDEASPFYQMNLNDLKPFASLEVTKIDEFDITDGTCVTGSIYKEEDIDKDEPNTEELKSGISKCVHKEWGEWSPCIPFDGVCGFGSKTRTQIKKGQQQYRYFQETTMTEGCNEDTSIQTQPCELHCG